MRRATPDGGKRSRQRSWRARDESAADLPASGGGETVERLAGGDTVRIERIVSHGEASPAGFWYDQDEAEFVMLLSGGARLSFADGEALTLGPGDWADIAPHRCHRVDWTDRQQPTVWLAVFYR